MTPADRAALSKSFEDSRRQDKVVALLRAWDRRSDNSLAAFDALTDVERLRLRREARVHVPSAETLADLREQIRARLPELQLLTPELRAQLEDLERARRAATDGQVTL